jgi:hypothetical protein
MQEGTGTGGEWLRLQKKIDRRKSLTSDMEEQLDSNTSQIQKATTENVRPK